MSTLAVSLLAGALFGLALAAPPGPMNAIIAEESVLRGWDAGFRAGLGAMTADALFCVLAFAGVATVLAENANIQPVMYAVGGLLMLYFAVGAASEAIAESGFRDAESTSSDTTGFRKTFVLSLSNPYQIAFWVTVGVGLVSPGTLDVFAHVPGLAGSLSGSFVVRTGSPALLLGFFAGIAIWIVGYPATMVAARERVDALAPIVALGSAVVLAGFGALFLWLGVDGVV